MGFEVFTQCFTHGERDGIAIAEVRRAFGSELEVEDQDWWKVVYDEKNHCSILVGFLLPDRQLVHSLTVDRPCSDRRLWESLLALLRLGHVVLYFPAEKPPLLVADASVSQHLPKSMVESMGAVTCVHSAEDIIDAIKRA